jgi:hypothetical protein
MSFPFACLPISLSLVIEQLFSLTSLWGNRNQTTNNKFWNKLVLFEFDVNISKTVF